MVDLEPGDFLYEANNELFLVVTSNNENEIEFAVHGWRTIDKDRLDNYLNADKPVMHTSDQVESVINEVDDPSAEEKFDWLTDIFEQYKHVEVDATHHDFSMDDSP